MEDALTTELPHHAQRYCQFWLMTPILLTIFPTDVQGWVGCGIAPSGGTGVVGCPSTELENLENEYESSSSRGDEGELDDAMSDGGNESKIHDECDPCLKKSEDRYGDSA